MTRLVVASRVPVPAGALYALREDPWNLRPLSLPILNVHLEAPSRPVQPGDVHHLHVHLPTIELRWELEVIEVVPGSRIVDVQRSGTFRSWRHQHIVLPRGEMESILVDVVDFRLFSGPLGPALDRFVVRPVLWLQFANQHRRLRQLVERHRPFWRRPIPRRRGSPASPGGS